MEVLNFECARSSTLGVGALRSDEWQTCLQPETINYCGDNGLALKEETGRIGRRRVGAAKKVACACRTRGKHGERFYSKDKWNDTVDWCNVIAYRNNSPGHTVKLFLGLLEDEILWTLVYDRMASKLTTTFILRSPHWATWGRLLPWAGGRLDSLDFFQFIYFVLIQNWCQPAPASTPAVQRARPGSAVSVTRELETGFPEQH